MKPLPELTAFLEGLPEPHILFDAQYRILAANGAYRRQFSPERSVIGRHQLGDPAVLADIDPFAGVGLLSRKR